MSVEQRELRYRVKAKTTKRKVNFKILSLSLAIVLLISIVYKFKGNGQKGFDNFYKGVIGHVMPMFKSNKTENYSLNERILKLIGIDMKNPLSILNKEIACLKGTQYEDNPDIEAEENMAVHSGDVERKNKEELKWKEFNIKEEDIFKEQSQNDNNSNKKDLVVEAYNPNLKKTLDVNKPEVFIYHTHTKEAYYPPGPTGYFSSDEDKSVVSVAKLVKKELEEKYGILVVHDKTMHDNEAYATCYNRSGETIKKNLSKFSDFKLIIDMHRDSVGNNKDAITMNINGEPTAKFMIVMDTKHKGYEKNLEVAKKISDISNKIFPNFLRRVYTVNGGTKYYNQEKNPNSILIEVGADCNTLKEAQNSSKYIARIIAEYINGKN